MSTERIIYVVQSFSRGVDGTIVFDAPAWSRDRSFAASLSQALSHTKAGVLAVGAVFNARGEVAAVAEIVASHGIVPTSLVLPMGLAPEFSKPEIPPAARVRRRA
ncbi:MAG: hypothetical protein ACJ8CS_04480 [Microvirga sp.]|jgi:hypothetical protein